HNQLSDYSYAVYKNNQLIQRYGKFQYSFYFHWGIPVDQYGEAYESNYLHLIYKNDEQTIVVISKEKQPFWDWFTTNSYFFMFFSLILLLFLYALDWRARKNMLDTSLNLRIQLLLVSVVLVSLVGLGVGTFIFITKQSEIKNSEALDEKIKSVLSELETELGNRDALETNYKEYTAYIITNISNIFNADITVFDLKGNLYASSQPKLFDEGIISKKMNPVAFDNIISGSFVNFVIKENIGNLNYYSAYQPFYNKSGKLLAYINLPYFAKQKELEKEISVYIVALINIYVILFAFSTIAALFISNLVTKPLRMIQLQLSKTRLDKRNESIQWSEKDEIGSLVNEYNGMIAQLEESAQKLAKSERESAWREMAKQVAHEIKNPLTPMKLSIQHLQRTLEGNPEDIKKRINTLSFMLIEQIDTLSHIANEFSSFAKMPKATIERLDIVEIVVAATELFKESEQAKVVFSNKTSAPVFVNADKTQLVRVFTNLIKNAIQSVPPERESEIIVSLYKELGYVVVEVRDNGTGIAPELLNKIFEPNFSTKTEGMGLGLAMVKNIIESFNG
ncbi:MAG TPA: ATP-binding protein, partial [Nitrosopumilaceae archaeon]|nr:ATP-binding protein [Nitrosopumilaceae archaeon]